MKNQQWGETAVMFGFLFFYSHSKPIESISIFYSNFLDKHYIIFSIKKILLWKQKFVIKLFCSFSAKLLKFESKPINSVTIFNFKFESKPIESIPIFSQLAQILEQTNWINSNFQQSRVGAIYWFFKHN